MIPNSDRPEELLWQEVNKWKLQELYVDINRANNVPLSKTKKKYLQGLLCGLLPAEIAKAVNRKNSGVRVEVCTLYRYVETMLELPVRTINCVNLRNWLEQAGYKKGSKVTGLELPDESTSLVNTPFELDWDNSNITGKGIIPKVIRKR